MTLDRRLHAVRDDLADERLRARIDAPRYVAGTPARIAVPVADMLSAPRADSGLDTQLLMGADVMVFDRKDGFAWVQADADGYVGYVAEADLGDTGATPTHVVRAPRTFVYAEPDMKKPRRAVLPMGARVTVVGEAETRGTRYLLTDRGEALVAGHLRPVGETERDFVAVAETLEHTPYLWGGASGFGIDCSGLVQLAMRMAGGKVPRDTDMQAAGIGVAIDPGPSFSALQRGDLVFWKGHVAIVMEAATILHANGHTMSVARESLAGAVNRIGYLYGGPTAFRRP